MKSELTISNFNYHDKCFNVTIDEFEKIHTGDIEIENLKTGNKEIFTFISGNNTEKKFKNDKGLLLIIINHEKNKKYI